MMTLKEEKMAFEQTGKIYESALEYAMQIGLDTELYTKGTY